jgi:hypothetical protein
MQSLENKKYCLTKRKIDNFKIYSKNICMKNIFSHTCEKYPRVYVSKRLAKRNL